MADRNLEHSHKSMILFDVLIRLFYMLKCSKLNQKPFFTEKKIEATLRLCKKRLAVPDCAQNETIYLDFVTGLVGKR